jgi:benzoyl-CoA reductase/2-hydroxyglutaryl-CoA dehydratase subunit BcrC/BadD/HgdB
MSTGEKPFVGFACAYTPVQMIHAAGFVPYRILPEGEAPDQAGTVLHDNMCPHVKRILDRALDNDLPDLAGLVLMASCDAMRRLADAWKAQYPAKSLVLVDLPFVTDERSAAFFADELKALATVLSDWAGRPVDPGAVRRSIELYNKLVGELDRINRGFGASDADGGRVAFQKLLNDSVTRPVEETIREAQEPADKGTADSGPSSDGKVRVLVFGNVLPDPEAFELFEECGAHVAADDLCTGSRQLAAVDLAEGEDVFVSLARGLLGRPPCARTLSPDQPLDLARHVVKTAGESGARGVVAYVIKFCDPYLSRLPAVREELKEAGLPLLVLEGDCTLRSLGQHRTRIEAFVEMLKENA